MQSRTVTTPRQDNNVNSNNGNYVTVGGKQFLIPYGIQTAPNNPNVVTAVGNAVQQQYVNPLNNLTSKITSQDFLLNSGFVIVGIVLFLLSIQGLITQESNSLINKATSGFKRKK